MAINKEFLGKTNLEPLFDPIKIKKVELAWTHTAVLLYCCLSVIFYV